MNELSILLDKYPSKPWNSELLSENPNVTLEIVRRNSWVRWDFRRLSRVIDAKSAMETLGEFDWDIGELSKNRTLTYEIYRSRPCAGWDMYELSCRLPFKVIVKKDISWNMLGLWLNRTVTVDDVLEYPKFCWHLEYMTTHLPLWFLLERNVWIDKTGMSYAQLPIEDLWWCERNLGGNWLPFELSKNPHVTREFVDHLGWNGWDWETLGCVTGEDALRLKEPRILSNPKVSVEFGLKYKNEFKDACMYMSSNPTLRAVDVVGAGWSFYGLSKNRWNNIVI